MREFTTQDVKEIETAQEALRQARFDVDGQGAAHNAKIILDFFDKNPSVPLNTDTIYRLVDQNKAAFVWLSDAASRYYEVARNSDENLVSSVMAWLNGRQKLLVREGDEGFENLTMLLQELRGWTFTDLNAQAAIGRAQAKNRKIHFVPERNQNSYRDNPLRHTGNESFMPKSETNQNNISRFLPNHAEPAPALAPLSKDDQNWKRVAESYLRTGRTHSQNAELQAEFKRLVDAREPWRTVAEAIHGIKQKFDKSAMTSGNMGR